jgi:hypothetical protein
LLEAIDLIMMLAGASPALFYDGKKLLAVLPVNDAQISTDGGKRLSLPERRRPL